MWLGLLCFGSALSAQTNFTTLVSHGSDSNRVNVVFLAEGYRTNQYAQFLTDATNAASQLLTNAPYAEYTNYVNVHAIAVPSVQSGSDHPASGYYSNTFFNSTYGASEYFMSIPPNDYDASYNNGQGKVDALLATYLPQADLAILLVNDNAPGGSDGGGKTAIVSRGAVTGPFYGILPHETGHVFAGLGDEYTTPNPGYPDIEEPNTTRETNRAAIKWRAWISTNTPVPTPPTSEYLNAVGLFEGAHYHTNGWYRPKINCMMGSFGVGFCEVCQEAMVLACYRQVRPIDSFTPASTNLSTTTNQPLNFALTLLQPSTHALAVQWLTNGAAAANATNANFSIAPVALGNGTNTVTASVMDPTPLVRTDTSNLLSQTRSWTVTVSIPMLQLSAPHTVPGGGFAFRVSGVAPAGFAVQASANLAAWTSLTTNMLVNGQFDYTNFGGSNLPIRLFRAITPPGP